MKKLILTITLIALSVPAFSENPGRVAGCVSLRTIDEKTIEFHNGCGEKVFVIYCGDLVYSNKKCGDGPDGGYFTQSINLAPGQNRRIDAHRIQYGACYGSIGFGHEEFSDTPMGRFSCNK